MVDIFPVLLFFADFFSDKFHLGRPGVRFGMGVRFYGFYSKHLLVILENHKPHAVLL